jgi:ABC-2 family transporter protein
VNQLVAKEVRVLLGLWLSCIVVVGAGGLARDHFTFPVLPLIVCYMGSIALGAWSVGHEYSHGTLTVLLSQPVGRARIFFVKQVVLGLMLLIVAGVGWTCLRVPVNVAAAFVTLSLLCGFCVAPWLTMLTRNPLAGTVFTIQIPGFLWVGAQLLFHADRTLIVFWSATLAVCATAALLGWRTFMRLEAIDGRGSDLRLHFTRSAVPPGPRDQHAIWLLIKKEIGLQQLSLALAGFYCVVWLALMVAGQLEPAVRDSRGQDLFGALTFLYGGMLALLIGALTSAEERQLGTLEWQVLLPMSSAKQWAVKAGTAIGLTVLLVAGLPGLIFSVSGMAVRGTEVFTPAILLMMVVSLYVSSISSNGLRAFLLSLPVTLVMWFFIAFFTKPRWWSSPLLLGPVAAAVVIILWLSFENHRSAGRRGWLLRS